jgi:hypothetical protein
MRSPADKLQWEFVKLAGIPGGWQSRFRQPNCPRNLLVQSARFGKPIPTINGLAA